MSNTWETLTECLRNELQEYGALLSLFEEQQSNLLRRDATAVAALAAEIEAQARATQGRRERREQLVRDFALEHQAEGHTSLRQLIPFFPSDVQPLLQALIHEINHLIHRIRRGARQNQILLSRTVEAHQEALRLCAPDRFVSTYSNRGQVHAGAGATSGWQAAG